MFAAQMDLAKTVLCHAGGLEQHLVEWGVGSLGNFLECLWREIIGRGAETWLNLLACDVQLLGEDVKVHRNTGIIGLAAAAGGSSASAGVANKASADALACMNNARTDSIPVCPPSKTGINL